MPGSLLVERRGDIAVVTLDRPPVNALDREFLETIADGFGKLGKDDCRAIVLTGKGSCFSAGADLFRVVEGDSEYVDSAVPSLTAAFAAVFEIPKPVVAAVNGHAIAGGAIFVCACDYRFMADGDGLIGVSELKVGVPFPTYAIEIVRHAVSRKHFQELVYLADVYSPADALDRGFIDQVVPAAELLERALEMAERLSEIPAASFAAMKSIMRRPTLDRIAAYTAEHDPKAQAGWNSEVVQSAIRRFLSETFGR